MEDACDRETCCPDRPKGPWRCLVVVSVSFLDCLCLTARLSFFFHSALSFPWMGIVPWYATDFSFGCLAFEAASLRRVSWVFSSSLLARELTRPRYDPSHCLPYISFYLDGRESTLGLLRALIDRSHKGPVCKGVTPATSAFLFRKRVWKKPAKRKFSS